MGRSGRCRKAEEQQVLGGCSSNTFTRMEWHSGSPNLVFSPGNAILLRDARCHSLPEAPWISFFD